MEKNRNLAMIDTGKAENKGGMAYSRHSSSRKRKAIFLDCYGKNITYIKINFKYIRFSF